MFDTNPSEDEPTTIIPTTALEPTKTKWGSLCLGIEPWNLVANKTNLRPNSNDQGNTSNRKIKASNMCEMGKGYRLNQKQSHIHDRISHNIEKKHISGQTGMESCLKGSYLRNNNLWSNNSNKWLAHKEQNMLWHIGNRINTILPTNQRRRLTNLN